MCTCSTSIKLLLNCTGTHNILSDTLLCDQINPKLDNFYKINVNHDSKRTTNTAKHTLFGNSRSMHAYIVLDTTKQPTHITKHHDTMDIKLFNFHQN